MTSKYGKLFYINTNSLENKYDKNSNPININSDSSKDQKCGILKEITSNNGDSLFGMNINEDKAICLTSKNNMLEWNAIKISMSKSGGFNFNKDQKDQKPPYYFLKQKPSFIFIRYKFTKIKISNSIAANTTNNVCLALDSSDFLYVWGNSSTGLLGLGYKITEVNTPTKLNPLKHISDFSISESHAISINSSGEVFSWGSGKYGELCIKSSIYSPYPTPMNNDKLYSKVFCSDLITCFIDKEGRFSYYGVIIRILLGNYSSLTIKKLLEDNTIDSETMFQEKVIVELENEKIIHICTANGFLALLSERGLVFTLEKIFLKNITLF